MRRREPQPASFDSDYLSTVNSSVVVLVVVPLLPVMVMGYVPYAALLETISVKSEVPEPVMDVGLKLPVTPLGRPVADSATAELNPPEPLTVTTA
jgi:hypothetical protein